MYNINQTSCITNFFCFQPPSYLCCKVLAKCIVSWTSSIFNLLAIAFCNALAKLFASWTFFVSNLCAITYYIILAKRCTSWTSSISNSRTTMCCTMLAKCWASHLFSFYLVYAFEYRKTSIAIRFALFHSIVIAQ